MKKALSLFLAFIIALSAFGIQAFSATAENVAQYGKQGGYLAIGDSISRGCGADGFYMDTDKAEGGQYDLFDLRNVEGAFPYLIAQAVGCEAPADITDQSGTYWPCTYPGMTVAMMLDLLGVEDNFSDTALDYMYYDDMLKYFGWEGSFDGTHEGEKYTEGECGLCGKINELTGRASLITVQLGMADVFYRAYRIATNGGSLAGGLSFDADSADAIKELVSTAISELKASLEYWQQYYPVLIEKIKALNPDATIVMVGTFNLVSDLTLLDDTMAPLGSLMNIITEKMNTCLEEWAEKYNVLYANIENAETLATEKGWSLLGDFKDNSFAATHPSQNGYNYITRQVLSVLPERENYKDLVLDIGTLETVDYVLINGIKTDNYTVEGRLLTIPAPVIPGNLTIGMKNENGKITVRTYSVTYTPGEGYSAKRLYGNSDALGFFLRPFRLIASLFRLIIEKLSSGN